MVLAADDQQVVSVIELLNAHIVISLVRVPQQDVRDTSLWYPASDDVGAVRQLLGVDRDLVVDRRVGREHRRPGSDDRTRLCLDPYAIAFDAVITISGVTVQSATALKDHLRKTTQVPRRVETTLVWKTQGAAGLKAGHRGIVRPLHFHADAAADVIFFLKVGNRPFIRRHEIAVEPPKLAVDILLAANRFDAVDSCDLTFVVEPRFVFTSDLDELRIEVVELGREMRSSARGHTIAGTAAVNHNDRAAEPCQFIGGRQPRDT